MSFSLFLLRWLGFVMDRKNKIVQLLLAQSKPTVLQKSSITVRCSTTLNANQPNGATNEHI